MTLTVGSPLAEPAAPVRAPVTVSDLTDVIAQVWQSFAPGEVEPVLDRSSTAVDHAGGCVGTITVDGDWTGVVLLACSPGAAHRWARVMWQLPDGENPSAEDVSDSVAELVNVVGGNVKALCAEGGRLGLPVLLDALPGAGERVPQLRVVLSWPDAPQDALEVRLLAG